MLHVTRMLERRYPQHGPRIVRALLLVAALAVLAGLGLLALR